MDISMKKQNQSVIKKSSFFYKIKNMIFFQKSDNS